LAASLAKYRENHTIIEQVHALDDELRKGIG
jgi:hypothetical protein